MSRTLKEYTAAEFRALLAERYEDFAPEATVSINRWLARGDSVAVYENVDLGHPDLGDIRAVSFGSPAAMFETVTDPADLPERLPDNIPRGAINYRYYLQGTYRGRPL
jgi:hypothetical protein